MDEKKYWVNVNKFTANVMRTGCTYPVASFSLCGDDISIAVAKLRAQAFADMLNAGELMEVPERYYCRTSASQRIVFILDRQSSAGDYPVRVDNSVLGVGPFPAAKVAERICAMLNEMDRAGELETEEYQWN